MKRLLGFKSIAECARKLGLERRTIERRVNALRASGQAVTAESLLEWRVNWAPKAARLPWPVMEFADSVKAAKHYKLSRTTLWERMQVAKREGKPWTKAVLIDAYGPTGRRRGVRPVKRKAADWARMERWAGRLIEADPICQRRIAEEREAAVSGQFLTSKAA